MKEAPEINLSFESVQQDGGRAIAFASAIHTAERLGHRVTVREWRDGKDRLYGLIATIHPQEAKNGR